MTLKRKTKREAVRESAVAFVGAELQSYFRTLHGNAVCGQAEDVLVLVIALIAVLLATVNLVGGFVVTDRMLDMFSGRKKSSTAPKGEGK